MITRIWHGATPATKRDECLNLMRIIAIPDYRARPPATRALKTQSPVGEPLTIWTKPLPLRFLLGGANRFPGRSYTRRSPAPFTANCYANNR
jgi:hypothetical protein